MDRISKKRRSWNMSRIRSHNTKPEIVVRKFLFRKGLRYRCNYKMTGKPDVVFPRNKIAVFVHGCFWHLHECANSGIPKTNSVFWRKKLTANRLRDRRIVKELIKNGWFVITVWECEIENGGAVILNRLYRKIRHKLLA